MRALLLLVGWLGRLGWLVVIVRWLCCCCCLVLCVSRVVSFVCGLVVVVVSIVCVLVCVLFLDAPPRSGPVWLAPHHTKRTCQPPRHTPPHPHNTHLNTTTTPKKTPTHTPTLYSYIIPTPVVKHFITDYERNGAYTGFPCLGVEWQKLENPDMREALKMKVRVFCDGRLFEPLHTYTHTHPNTTRQNQTANTNTHNKNNN